MLWAGSRQTKGRWWICPLLSGAIQAKLPPSFQLLWWNNTQSRLHHQFNSLQIWMIHATYCHTAITYIRRDSFASSRAVASCDNTTRVNLCDYCECHSSQTKANTTEGQARWQLCNLHFRNLPPSHDGICARTLEFCSRKMKYNALNLQAHAPSVLQNTVRIVLNTQLSPIALQNSCKHEATNWRIKAWIT